MPEYIDREAAKETHCNICKEYHICYRGRDCVTRKAFDKIPAADVVPVVFANWTWGKDGMLHCSNCDKIPVNRVEICIGKGVNKRVYNVEPIERYMLYCPKCGACMKPHAPRKKEE